MCWLRPPWARGILRTPSETSAPQRAVCWIIPSELRIGSMRLHRQWESGDLERKYFTLDFPGCSGPTCSRAQRSSWPASAELQGRSAGLWRSAVELSALLGP